MKRKGGKRVNAPPRPVCPLPSITLTSPMAASKSPAMEAGSLMWSELVSTFHWAAAGVGAAAVAARATRAAPVESVARRGIACVCLRACVRVPAVCVCVTARQAWGV